MRQTQLQDQEICPGHIPVNFRLFCDHWPLFLYCFLSMETAALPVCVCQREGRNSRCGVYTGRLILFKIQPEAVVHVMEMTGTVYP